MINTTRSYLLKELNLSEINTVLSEISKRFDTQDQYMKQTYSYTIPTGKLTIPASGNLIKEVETAAAFVGDIALASCDTLNNGSVIMAATITGQGKTSVIFINLTDKAVEIKDGNIYVDIWGDMLKGGKR